MKVLGYVRVSTEEQRLSGAGLLAQRSAIEQEIARRDWHLEQMVEDSGYSARNLKRPGIQSALETLKAGGADALLVAKLDRLSRSMLDFTGLMDRTQREGWALIAMDCAVDTTTPAGEAMANILAAFAQFERKLIGQRTKEAMAAKKAAGQKFGRPRVLPAKVVSRIQRERKTGATLQAIADGLQADGIATAQGGVRWWPSTVRAILAQT